jgi:hypothetical protein
MTDARLINVQSDQKENKSEHQALQIIGHVVADPMQRSVQCRGVDNLWSQRLLYNKSYLMNIMIMEKIYKINKSNILHS